MAADSSVKSFDAPHENRSCLPFQCRPAVLEKAFLLLDAGGRLRNLLVTATCLHSDVVHLSQLIAACAGVLVVLQDGGRTRPNGILEV